MEKKQTTKKGKLTNKVDDNKLKEGEEEEKIPLRGFSLSHYVVTRFGVNNLLAENSKTNANGASQKP